MGMLYTIVDSASVHGYHSFGYCRNVQIILHTQLDIQTHTLVSHMHIAPINTLKNQSIKFHLMHPEPPIHIDAIPLRSIGIGCNWYTAINDDFIRTIHVKRTNSYWMFLLFNRHSKLHSESFPIWMLYFKLMSNENSSLGLLSMMHHWLKKKLFFRILITLWTLEWR